jgi:hypothetical protein
MTPAELKEYNRRYYAANKTKWPASKSRGGSLQQCHWAAIGAEMGKIVGYRRTEKEVLALMPGEFKNTTRVKYFADAALGHLICLLRESLREPSR